MPVAAGAADVDRVGRRLDRDQPRPHRARRARDLGGRLAPIAQRDEEPRNVLVVQPAIEHRAEGRFGLGFFERMIDRREFGHAGTLAGRPQTRRKFASNACPGSVAMLSGWNCTPWIGSSRWRKPITLVPSSPGVSLVALTTRASGISSTTSE